MSGITEIAVAQIRRILDSSSESTWFEGMGYVRKGVNIEELHLPGHCTVGSICGHRISFLPFGSGFVSQSLRSQEVSAIEVSLIPKVIISVNHGAQKSYCHKSFLTVNWT
jgi:hypothetical protein